MMPPWGSLSSYAGAQVARARAESAGVRVVWEASLEAEQGEPEAATIHLHPRDVGGAIQGMSPSDRVSTMADLFGDRAVAGAAKLTGA